MNQTENLKLNKYDPIADAKQPFSISDGLNANWDIIDSELVKKQNGSAYKLTLTGAPALQMVMDNNIGATGELLGDIHFTYQGIRVGMIRARNKDDVRNLDLTVMDETGAFKSTLSLQTSQNGSYTAIKAPASDIAGSICTTGSLSKSSNGYVKFGNGIILQWGKYYVTSGSSVQITLPTAFSSTTSYGFVCTDGGSARVAMGFTRNSSTKVTIYAANSGNGGDWIAIGY